jgi:threonine synthase
VIVTILFRCHGCGARVDAALALPFRCPQAGSADDIDHVLAPELSEKAFTRGSEQNPFLRYRALLSPYRLARASGLSDTTWSELVAELDAVLMAVDGRGFRVTPTLEQKGLASALGLKQALWVKDETGNVSGSHKSRHLMGVMLYLRVLEMAGLPAGKGLRARRLAIASCGNAALAAAVIARAADWPLDVFIPPDADVAVKTALRDLGANIIVCARGADPGDPCMLRFRNTVAQGAIPFSVQGPENGLAVEGARTLAFEMTEALAAGDASLDRLFVQVGGGALASALIQGFSFVCACGVIAKMPRVVAVQTAGCAPLARAWKELDGTDLNEASRHRSRYMWPWETASSSLASGILDDETYDWLAVVEGMRVSGGYPVIVDEITIARARELAWTRTGLRPSATGSAGLAGVIVLPDEKGATGVIFSGIER